MKKIAHLGKDEPSRKEVHGWHVLQARTGVLSHLQDVGNGPTCEAGTVLK